VFVSFMQAHGLEFYGGKVLVLALFSPLLLFPKSCCGGQCNDPGKVVATFVLSTQKD
jgi:hypothetical protein